ncbi:MAG: hypothetical protein CL715_04005 [Chloroflexi bacterium]|nr:hypothetical protein [Chloroflexota bacterium]
MPLKKIGTIKSSTSPKALPSIDGRPRLEVTAISAGYDGDLLGTPVLNSMATYQAEMKPSGNWQGVCPDSGIVIVADGVATFSATGVGDNTEDGGSSWKGVCYFQTSAPSLLELNGKCIVYYWNVDPQGIATWELHELS